MREVNSNKFNANIFERQCREIYWQLKQIGLEENESWTESRLILEHVTGLKQAEQITNDLKEFPAQWLEEITRIINLRRERRPLAYCLGEIEFAGLKFRIAPGVLIPRLDTETLVEEIVAWAKNIEKKDDASSKLNIAEIGVGSGIIAVSLLKRLANCTVWGCDISEAAVAITLGNARKHGVDDRLTVVHGDWKKILPKDFDVIVSNPPYIPISLLPISLLPISLSTNNAPIAEAGKVDPWGKFKHSLRSKKELQPELFFEPKEALFAGEDGLDFYRQFAQILPGHFSSQPGNGSNMLAAFEIGDQQSEAVSAIFKQKDWKDIEIKEDMNGLPRVCIASPP